MRMTIFSLEDLLACLLACLLRFAQKTFYKSNSLFTNATVVDYYLSITEH
jgi:hypothetical protein